MSDGTSDIWEALKRQKERERDNSAVMVALPFVLSAMIVGPILSGWVTTYLWRWFVMPMFAVPELHVAQAIGLMFIVRVFIGHRGTSDDKSKTALDRIATAFGGLVLSPLLIFAVGWFIHLFL